MTLGPALALATAGLAAQAPVAGEVFRVTIEPPDFVFRYTPRVRIPGQPTVALALSGGGSRGIAHVGILQRLEEGGYPVDFLAGTSAGALTGTLWAAGFSGRDIEALYRRLDLSRAFLDPLLRKPGESLGEQEGRSTGLLGVELKGSRLAYAQGLQSGAEVQRTLEGLLARAAYFSEGRFDRLRVPLRILATNIETGQGRAFGEGNLVGAVRASMAVPGAFSPVVIEGQQYVDGAFTENIPARHARAVFRPSTVLAVDVSAPFAEGQASNFFSITAKSLDLMVEHQQTESRASADLVLRPAIPAETPFLDYQAQLGPLVAAGRAAFDQREEAWRRTLRAAWGEDQDLPATGLDWLGSPPPEGLALAAELLPEGRPPTRQGVQILLQQLVARGLVQEADARVAGDRVQVRVVPHPPIAAVVLEVPEELRPRLEASAAAAFRPGQRHDPQAFGAFLGAWVTTRILEGAPLTDVRGSGFDPATGRLRIRVAEPVLRDLEVLPAEGGRLDPRDLQALFAPLMGRALRPRELQERIELAQQRFRLASLEVDLHPTPAGEVAARLRPVARHLNSLDLILGYESTLGGLLGFRARSSNLGLRGLELEASGARNRLQQQGGVTFRVALPATPATLELEGDYFLQRLETPLQFPAAELPGPGLGGRVSASNLRLQTAFHFGQLDRGRAVLGLEQRDGATHAPEGTRRAFRTYAGFLSAEWDNFDRHTLPRNGLLVRLRYAGGRTQNPADLLPFQESYLRVRGLQPLAARLGLEGDVEVGLGRHLPLDRWWTLGGPSFLVGTSALGFLAPNFAAVRLGLPYRLSGPLGTTLEVAPRLDHGWVAAAPGDLGTGRAPLGRAAGLMVKTTLARFYVELAYGWFSQRPPGQGWTRPSGSFNVRVGMQPFDLWRRR